MKIYPIILSVLFSINLYSQIGADVATPFSDQVISGIGPITVSVEGVFEDTTVSGTVVKFETNAPLADNDFYVELTSNTPLTNANFLSYVNSGAYDNSMFHRSVSDFVLQGGGFKHPTVAADQPGSDPVAIPTTGTVQNEPGNLNTRGTIAMAKLGGQPDSATSQFFFNLSDNSFLDSDNGGYTQFGSVLGSGMTVVDTIGSAITYDATTYYSNTALSDLPLWNVNEDNIVLPQDFVQIENADAVTESALFTYSASSSDPAKLTASFNGNGDLVLTPVGDATGTVSVTVIATSSLDNSTASDTFSVTFEEETVEAVEETKESVEEETESVEDADEIVEEEEDITESVEETVEETIESVEEETNSAEETASSQSASAYGSITLVQPNSNKSYELVTTAMTWSNAKAYAESQDGYLMEINSSEEQDYIEESLEDILSNMSYGDYNNLINGTIASDGGGSAYLWLGGSDSDSEGVWLWASNSEQFWSGGKNGTAVNGSFNLWGTTTQQNEPDNYGGSQDALALALETWPYATEGTSSKLGSVYSWNDINANNELYFIIEKDLEAAEEEPSWVPQGWVYYAWPYAYSFSEGRWYFFNESDTQWRVNLTSAAWGELNAASGWNYYAWPYSYSFDEGAWHWYNNDTQWVVDLLSGEWATFGSSGN